MTTRDALEAALVANPDDVVRHAAYADLLIEEGDPRGEFIRLQLAAEDRNQPVSKLRELEDAAHKIRQEHEQEWLGDLWQFTQRPPHARSVAVPMEANVTVTWRRGWIDGIRVWQTSRELVRLIAANPFTRLLGSLTIVHNSYQAEGADEHPAEGLPIPRVDVQTVPGSLPLIDAGRFANLRHFELGSREDLVTAVGVLAHGPIARMPRLESLRLNVDQFSEAELFGGDYPRLHTIDITYNNPRCRYYMLGMNDKLPNLKRLSLDTVAIMPERGELGSEREPITPTDLRTFFRTKYLKALEYLTFRNGEFGDAGVEELLASGFITRLKGLDLCRCNITDAGAELLANYPHTPKLDYLHLDNNLLSPIGIDALETAGQRISPNQFFGPMPRDFAAEFDAEIRAELGMDDTARNDDEPI